MDGGPHQIINPGSSWKPYFTINQQASTLWYHPHIMGTTGEQVYKGLAGLFFIEDDISKSLDIPKEYGVNDIPLVVQDKRFTREGDIPYNLNMRDLMDGFLGDTVLINGAIEPQLDVKNEMLRLRFLNGSNARNYLFRFSGNKEFYQIASDGGFLEKAVELRELFLAPGERAEILIDLSSYEVGDKIYLSDTDYNILEINIAEEGDTVYKIPSKLTEIEKYKLEDIKNTRLFEMAGMGRDVNINGKQMDMDRIDENVKLKKLEEWIITNKSMGMGMMNSMGHPFHIHSTQFQILERNGKKPALNERGWKDTVMVQTGEEVRVLVKFKEKGLFMYHCHILEHEDLGMMGQFLVEE